MEEKNELNDIILNKSGSGSSTKKLLLAIAALTLILIIVLVIMNSLKSESDERAPQAAVPPEPSSPTEVIDDPLFEPVEVIQEGAGNVTTTETPQDLGQIAQKIKQESFQNAPVAASPAAASAPAAAQQTLPAPQAKPAVQTAPTAVNSPKVQAQPTAVKAVAPAPAKIQTSPKAVQPVITPTIKTTKPAETKPVAAAPKSTPVAAPKTTATASTTQKPAVTPTKVTAAPVQKTAAEPAAKPVAKAPDTTGTYYIQVGSFSKEPNKALFDRLNASGLKYITSPSGSMTKVMVGPFQGEKAARDVLGTVKRNIESNAYITKG